jgi:hypothetical protein
MELNGQPSKGVPVGRHVVLQAEGQLFMELQAANTRAVHRIFHRTLLAETRVEFIGRGLAWAVLKIF